MGNPETQLISESMVITVIITTKHLMCVCYIVADGSKSLIILHEVGISEIQLPDKNREVPGGQAAQLWPYLAGG